MNPFPHPHCQWPPLAQNTELEDLLSQRQLDISIKGKSGPIKQLEDNFISFLQNNAKHCISFNSGTSALLAAYFSIGIEEGDEVIGPVLTYHAALSPLFMLKANPVLVDVCKDTRCIDPAQIEEKITDKTKAITVVHQWGHPCDMDAIMEIAKKFNLKVIEDCSHAHGSKINGRFCGTIGDIGVFSLQAAKAVYAGEGGLLVTSNDKYHDRSTLLGHYRDRSKEEISDQELQQYWVSGFGLKLRMSPFNAVVAIHSLRNFPKIKEERHKCLNYLNDCLKGIEFIKEPHIAKNIDMGAWYGYKPLFLPEKLNGLSREVFVRELKIHGLEIKAPSAPPLFSLPLYNKYPDSMFNNRKPKRTYNESDFPNAANIGEQALSFPTFYNWDLHKPIIDHYVKTIYKIGIDLQTKNEALL